MAKVRSKGSKSITVEKEGYLFVKKNVSALKAKEKSWQTKYIVLRKSLGYGTCLEWYDNFEAFMSHKNPTKHEMDDVDYISHVDMEKDYAFILFFSGGKSQLTMAAKNEMEREEWIKALKGVQNGKKSTPTSPTTQGNGGKFSYQVKLRDYDCQNNQDILQGSNRDYILVVYPKSISLITVDVTGKQKPVLDWLLTNIKSYDSQPEPNTVQKLLSIETGRGSFTGKGTFNFYTPHGDQIKTQIRLNIKRSFMERMNSQDSFNMENPDSSRQFSSSPRSFSMSVSRSPVVSPRRGSSKDGPIPFHKYDPPTNSESYTPYIQQENGYIHVLTDPRKVEANRKRPGSRSSISSSRFPYSEDHPTYVRVPEDHQAAYIPVLPNEESDRAYIDVLAEQPPELEGYSLLKVLNEEEESHTHQYIDIIDDNKPPLPKKRSDSDDGRHQYIDVIPDDIPTLPRKRLNSDNDRHQFVDVVDDNKPPLPKKRSDSDEGRHQYIDVIGDDKPTLPRKRPDSNDRHQYIEVLSDEKSSSPKKESESDHHYIEVLDDEKSADHEYIEVSEDHEQPRKGGLVRESSEEVEIYIDVDENKRKYNAHRSQLLESNEQHFESGEQFSQESEQDVISEQKRVVYESQIEIETHYMSSSSTRITRSSETVDVTRHTRESMGSFSSPRWPRSVASGTSADFSSLSSENDVFPDKSFDREMSVVVEEVFTEKSKKAEAIPINSDVPKQADAELTNISGGGTANSDIYRKAGESDADTVPTNSESPLTKSDLNKSEEDLKSRQYLIVLPPKPALVLSKSASLPVKSEGLATNSGSNSSGVNQTRNELSPTPDRNNRSAKARSWHSENGSDIAYTSGNSTSTSESENTRDSHDFSDDEHTDHTDDSTGLCPRDPLGIEVRNRSHTASELYSLRSKENDASLLAAFENSLTNPQQFLPCGVGKHPPLTRETPYTQDQVIASLENPIENPILGVSPVSHSKKSSEIEFKYICSECGWHKKSKKGRSYKPSFRSKTCPICKKPVTRQDAKSVKNRSGSILTKFIGKKGRRGSDEKSDINEMKPERRTTEIHESLFIKRFKDSPTSFLGRHSSSWDPKRSEMGIAPSPLHAIGALSIGGESHSRGSISNDESMLPKGRNYVGATNLGKEAAGNGASSPQRNISSTPTKPARDTLGRTKSSPPLTRVESDPRSDTLVVESQESEKIPRKNSGLTLPTLPEVEDPTDVDQPHLLPGTPPPVIPPRTVPPPLPPRRGNNPASVSREDSVRLRRTQTDPTPAVSYTQESPEIKTKSRISRTLTDPGENVTATNENIRNAISLGNLLEDKNDDLLMMKVVSLSLGDGVDDEASPPPLPPRRGSGQVQSTAPCRVPNEHERFMNNSDSPRLEPRHSAEGRRHLRDAGATSPKPPLSARRSLEAKRDFQTRKPMYSTHVSGDS